MVAFVNKEFTSKIYIIPCLRSTGVIPAELSELEYLGDLYLHGNPDLTCWETQEALDWALSLGWCYKGYCEPGYIGPKEVCPP